MGHRLERLQTYFHPNNRKEISPVPYPILLKQWEELLDSPTSETVQGASSTIKAAFRGVRDRRVGAYIIERDNIDDPLKMVIDRKTEFGTRRFASCTIYLLDKKSSHAIPRILLTEELIASDFFLEHTEEHIGIAALRTHTNSSCDYVATVLEKAGLMSKKWCSNADSYLARSLQRASSLPPITSAQFATRKNIEQEN